MQCQIIREYLQLQNEGKKSRENINARKETSEKGIEGRSKDAEVILFNSPDCKLDKVSRRVSKARGTGRGGDGSYYILDIHPQTHYFDPYHRTLQDTLFLIRVIWRIGIGIKL